MSEAIDRWHTRAVTEAAATLATDELRGLAPAEAARRLALHGPNTIPAGQGRGPLRIFASQFSDFMVLVLLAAAVVAGFIGEPQDTVAIVVIVALNAILGFVQEYRAERAVAALRALATPQARVRRAGQSVVVAAPAIVPGDLVLLEAGGLVPADLRLVEAAQLRLDEAALSGESQPVDKIVHALDDADLPMADRRNLAFKGTLVTYGRGTGIVFATGRQTELGRIAGLLHEGTEARTPLQRRLTNFGQRLALAVLALCAVIFAAGVLRGEDPVLMLLTALSLAVAAIPEALPAVVTVSLALGARRMARHRALVRRLPAVETLGAVTYICSDKTGTLTENRMRVEAFAVDGTRHATPPPDPRADGPWSLLLTALAISNDAARGATGAPHGDPTEVALYVAAEQAGFLKDALETLRPRMAEVPFSSERARMTTIHRDGDGFIAFTKGAPEAVIAACTAHQYDAACTPVDAPTILATARALADRGLRVLAVAYRRLAICPEPATVEDVERDLTLVGLVGLLDPPRAEAKEAVALCQSAGIRVVMITGDHAATAHAIAQRLGIAGPADPVLTGPELARLSPETFAHRVQNVRVYARVAPEQKIRIVTALQDQGEFVAMTGDGVNDAPALRRANIGIAMGRGGTDVAREAAHMVLLDDNFATIVAAVREGRRIYDNIRKFVRYALTCNAGEIWTLLLAPLVGLPISLLPIHILWINLVTDGLPGLALAVEPAERRIMERPPRPPRESIFAHGLGRHAIWMGMLMAVVTLLTQAGAYHTGSGHWQSMTFTVLALSQMGHVLAIRSERDSLLQQGLASNLPLLGAVLLTFLLQLATLYVPMLRGIFKTEALTMPELSLCLGLSSVVFFAVELEKWVLRRRSPGDQNP